MMITPNDGAWTPGRGVDCDPLEPIEVLEFSAEVPVTDLLHGSSVTLTAPESSQYSVTVTLRGRLLP